MISCPLGNANSILNKILSDFGELGTIKCFRIHLCYCEQIRIIKQQKMNQLIQIDISEFGVRLKQERERLGLTLSDFALLGEVNRMTQMRYESGASSPTIDYLHKIGGHGVDSMFLMTGLASADLIPMQNAVAFSQAIDLIDGIAKLHNFTPPPEFRLRAVSQIYQRILKFGVKKVTPTLEDLLNAA